MEFAIAGVPCFADTFVQGVSSVLRMKFSAKTPRHRNPPKRYTKDCFKFTENFVRMSFPSATPVVSLEEKDNILKGSQIEDAIGGEMTV